MLYIIVLIYGELGRYPIDIDIKVRTISYWARLLSGKQAKFSNVFYRLSRNLNANGDTNLNWVYFIRTILCLFENDYEYSCLCLTFKKGQLKL
jgi:hypothetical protein